MNDGRSRLGLDEEHSFLEKLWLFLASLLIGPLVGLMLFAAIGTLQPPWNSVVQNAAQTLAVFWGLLLVFIWWRPRWFRRFYLWFEWKVVLCVKVFILGFLLYLAVMAAMNVFHAMGIL